jgi:hypothetical protein
MCRHQSRCAAALSIVFGTPIRGRLVEPAGDLHRVLATDGNHRVEAGVDEARLHHLDSVFSRCGSKLELPRIVPPWWTIPRKVVRSRGMYSPPRQPAVIPQDPHRCRLESVG